MLTLTKQKEIFKTITEKFYVKDELSPIVKVWEENAQTITLKLRDLTQGKGSVTPF